MFREGGGFTTSSDEPIMIGQMQVLDLDDVYGAAGAVKAQRKRLVQIVNEQIGGSIVERGGGARDIEVRPLPDSPDWPDADRPPALRHPRRDGRECRQYRRRRACPAYRSR